MLKLYFVILFLLFSQCCPVVCFAEGKVFAVLGKSMDDKNFQAVASGCNEFAQRNGDSCINISCKGAAHPRNQSNAFVHAIRRHSLDGVAVSVIDSRSLAKIVNLYKTRVPVVSFDSPFNPGDIAGGISYIGPDNTSLGRRLAAIAKEAYPGGGTILIMSDSGDPNLQQRVHGVRIELSGNSTFPMDKRLNGENNWTESAYSPVSSGDSIERTLNILEKIVTQIKPDVFIAVGHWPLLDADGYRRIIKGHKDGSHGNKLFIACATGTATDPMKKLIEDNLLNAIVGFDFFKIGELCYESMSRLDKHEDVPPKVVVPLFTITGGSMQ